MAIMEERREGLKCWTLQTDLNEELREVGYEIV